jgi:DNA-binding winged helix-turn-helix (wHTH) protein
MRDRIDLLEEENRQLREASEALISFPRSWGLTKMEARFVSALMRSKTGALSKEALMTALYGLEPDVEEKIIDVWACKLRKKFSAIGVAVDIRTVWGQGYTLTAEDRATLKAALEGLDGSADERHQAAMQAAMDELAARHEALIAENQRLQAQLDDPPVGAKPTASEKGWRRFAKNKPSRRASAIVTRGVRHGR